MKFLLLKNAFIAAEDADFYNHHGLDWKGFMRALLHFVTFSNQNKVEVQLPNN